MKIVPRLVLNSDKFLIKFSLFTGFLPSQIKLLSLLGFGNIYILIFEKLTLSFVKESAKIFGDWYFL